MPRTKISEFSATAGSNTDIDGINIAEGCAPSGINDAIRELMAQLKDFQAGDAGDPITVVGTLSAKGTSAAGGDLKLYEDTDNGTNYVGLQAPSSITTNISWVLPNADGTANQVLKTDGSGNLGWATAATGDVTLNGTQTLTNKTIAFGSNTLTDVASTNTAQTFTATKTFSGSSSALATALTNAGEVATVSATAATGTINYDVTTQSVLYYTSNASANWTVNFRASSGTSLNTVMSIGQSVSVAFLVTQGATAYYNSAVQVDGSSVTPKYQGGTAYAAGNASSIDVYMYTIIKTGSAAFTVLTSQTKFA